MSAPRPTPMFTVDQYLAYERQAEERHEYLDGEILGMFSESWEHGIISGNTTATLGTMLKGTPYVTLTKGMKVRSGPIPMPEDGARVLFAYPDVLVVGDEPEFHDAVTDVILNPTVILEVVSAFTEAFDEGTKFARYRRWDPTLKDYVLISQFEPRVVHHHRQAANSWQMREYMGLNTSFAIPSIQCTLRLAEVYDRIKWDAE